MVHMGAVKEICARKARKCSIMSCGHWVTTGQLIFRVEGRWICRDCMVP
jgi:hypothetical protein